uniref:Lipoprotein n=1 Tax=viral metagenome TaxID=1070528 RepID=A0A6M3K7E3_9ZZZZ
MRNVVRSILLAVVMAVAVALASCVEHVVPYAGGSNYQLRRSAQAYYARLAGIGSGSVASPSANQGPMTIGDYYGGTTPNLFGGNP